MYLDSLDSLYFNSFCMYMASFSLGPARIIKIKTTITEPQSQAYAIVLPLLCHACTQPE